jgi:DNA-binding NarL/FixJ family response regulator
VAATKAAVLVVDDDPDFRTFARTLLERTGLAVEEAADANEALAAVERMPLQLVLLDVKLPETSGYELYRELRDLCGEGLPIIFISGERVEAYDRVAGLLLGADDYLVKPFDPDELVARVRRSLGRRANGHSTSERGSEDLLADLTPREREVLALLAAGRSSKQIARQLVISPRTLGTHIQHILGKLNVDNRTQAVAVAHRAGLVLSPDVEGHVREAISESADQAANTSSDPVRFAS